MKNVRIGIIGMGNMGRFHADYIQAGQIEGAELGAVSDRSIDRIEKYRPAHLFATGEELIASGKVDAVLIATPHPSHMPLGIMALKAGLHILVEKPIAGHKADALRLIEEHKRHPGRVFGGMFQLRTEPRYARMSEIIKTGQLGEISRMSWIITDWFRTEAYYSSGGWRATWRGEGGGVLLNQCLHNLDTLQWLLGMPSKVRGFCKIGKHHNIEVEDDATAYFEYSNGATGIFVTSTGESPGTNRLEISGTLGKLLLENNRLFHTRNEVSMADFSKNSESGFAKPPHTTVEIPFENATAAHQTITQGFVNAILKGTAPIVKGEEGIHSVELANSILYSSLIDQTINLPMDAAAFEAKLNDLIANSKFEKKFVKSTAQDFTASFHR